MKQKIQKILLFCAILFCNIALSVEIFKFGKVESLPSIGVSFPVLQSSRQEPLKTPEVSVYQFSQGSDVWLEKRYSAEELWLGTQHIGAWVDSGANILQLARCTILFPQEFRGTDVKQEGFDLMISEKSEKIKEARFLVVKNKLAQWLKDYAGLQVAGSPMDVKFGNQRVEEAFYVPVNLKNYYACFFRLNKRFPGQNNAPENWFCILFSSPNPLSNEDNRYIQEGLIRKISGVSQGASTGPYSVNKNRSKVVKEYPYSPVRERAKQSIEALSDWWYMESDNYIMISNHARAERAAEEILNELELLRSYYVKLFPPFDGVENMDVGVVRFFATTEEYIKYLEDEPLVGLSAQQTAGIFTSGRVELVIRNVTESESYKHSIISKIIRHEGLHQYFYLAFGCLNTSPWFNEGHATTFESTKIDRGRIFIQEDDTHFQKVSSVIKDLSITELEEYLRLFLSMDYKAFYSVNPEFNYSLAHCLVYYLHRGAPLERKQPYKDIIPRYLEELARNPNLENKMLRATDYAFAEVDLLGFARRFAEFMKNSRLRNEALRRPL